MHEEHFVPEKLDLQVHTPLEVHEVEVEPDGSQLQESVKNLFNSVCLITVLGMPRITNFDVGIPKMIILEIGCF